MELEKASWQRYHLRCALRGGFLWKMMVGKYADNSLSKSKVRNYKGLFGKMHEWKVDRQVKMDVDLKIRSN